MGLFRSSIVVVLGLLAAVHCNVVLDKTRSDESACSASQIDVLTEFFHRVNGTGWKNNRGWLTGDPCGGGGWHGVRCNANGEVIALNLPMNELAGDIPPALSQLPQLQHIDFALNKLTSSLPSALMRGSGLQFVDISYNELTMNFTEWDCPSLHHLDAGWNDLVWGDLDDLVAAAPQLKIVKLDRLELTGSSLEGIMAASKLVELSLKSCGLDSVLALPGKHAHSSLERLDLSHNYMHGLLPSDLLCTLPSLRELILAGNRLTGRVPLFTECSQRSVISTIDIADNLLTGVQPPSTLLADRQRHGATSNLQVLVLSGNEVGSDPAGVRTLLGQHHSLRTFECIACSLRGRLRDILPRTERREVVTGREEILLGASLEVIRLDHNFVEGTVGRDLCAHAHLRIVSLHDNALGGHLPACLVQAPQIEAIDISDNLLEGIASFDRTSESLSVLRLEQNRIAGEAPLGPLRTVPRVSLADNWFDSCDAYGDGTEIACSDATRCFSSNGGMAFVDLCGNSLMYACTGEDSHGPQSARAAGPLSAFPHRDASRKYFRVCGTRNEFFIRVLQDAGWWEVDGEVDVGDDAWTAAYGACSIEHNALSGLRGAATVSRYKTLDPIADKGELSMNIALFRKQLRTLGLNDAILDFYPRSFTLPRQLPQWTRAAATGAPTGSAASEPAVWLMKPRAQCCGRGIHLISEPSVEAIQEVNRSKGHWYVQQFVHPPRLFRGKKFVFRLFALVTSFDPPRVFLFNNGLVFFSHPTAPYSIAEALSTTATNSSGGADKRRYISDYFFTEMQLQHAMSTKALLPMLLQEQASQSMASVLNETALWQSIHRVTLYALLSAQSGLAAVQRYHRRGSVYEVLGLDIAFDAAMQPFLCEINSAPNMGLEVNYVNFSLNYSGYRSLRQDDYVFKHNLMNATLHVAGVQETHDLESHRDEQGPIWQRPDCVEVVILANGMECRSEDVSDEEQAALVAESNRTCIGAADTRYLIDVHLELLRASSARDFLKTRPDERHLLGWYEPVYPCAGCLHRPLDGAENGTSLFVGHLPLRRRRLHLLSNWWAEVHEILRSASEPEAYKLEPALRWPAWLSAVDRPRHANGT